MKKVSFFAVCASLLLLASACTHESATCDTDTVSFQTEVLPILNSNCAMSGCHDSQTKEEGIDLSIYKGAAGITNAGNVSSSDLYEVITTTGRNIMPPAPRTALSSDQIAIVKKWIEQGAKNTNCP